MKRSHDPIDIHVGRRLRAIRLIRGLTQETVGVLVGVSFQQIQKYETGANRVGASRLFRLSLSLDVTPGYFFEGLPTTGPGDARDDALLEAEYG